MTSFYATCEFELPDRTVGNLLKVLQPEVQGEGDRTSVELAEEGGVFILKIGSKDIKGLRAAMNSYLRWIECSLKVNDISGM